MLRSENIRQRAATNIGHNLKTDTFVTDVLEKPNNWNTVESTMHEIMY